MARQLTITLSDEAFQGLRTAAGSRTLSEFIEDLARPFVSESALESEYMEMSRDKDREREAFDWMEGVIGDSSGGENAPR